MTFTNSNFNELLDFYKDKENFHKNAKEVFQSLSEVSKSNDKYSKPLIENDEIFVYNLDHLCSNSFLSQSGRINSSLPSSVDAIHFDGKIMFLMEFKGEFFPHQDNKQMFRDIIKQLENNKCSNPKLNCPLTGDVFNSFYKIQYKYDDEILCKLKTKPLESIFIVLPKMYERYCKQTEIEYNKVEYMDWLFNIPKRIIIVFNDDEYESEKHNTKSQKHLRRDYSLKTKYSPLKSIINTENSILTQSEFKKLFLDKIQN